MSEREMNTSSYLTDIVDKLTSSNTNIFIFAIDQSSSMQYYTERMRSLLESMKEDLSRIEQAGSILTATVRFSTNNNISSNSSDWPAMLRVISEMDCSYYSDGYTALYRTISDIGHMVTNDAQNGIYDSMINEGREPRIFVIILSDGSDEDTKSNYSVRFENAKASVQSLYSIGAIVAFANFGNNDGEKIAKELSILDICSDAKSERGLKALVRNISNSCKSASKRSASAPVKPGDFFDNSDEAGSPEDYFRGV